MPGDGGEFVEPSIGPKLQELYDDQSSRGLKENYDSRHLSDYKQFASLGPIHESVLRKGRHRQIAGHDDCTSCHFCRQCTEDLKPRCSQCGKHFCGPCLANRFGQNAHDMRARDDWSCPVCLDICNCSGSNCRRAQLGLGATASLIHEAQAFGYSSVRLLAFEGKVQGPSEVCSKKSPRIQGTMNKPTIWQDHVPIVQVAEYLLITALFREGTEKEARDALEWLANPERAFAARAFKASTAGTGVRINSRRRCRSPPHSCSLTPAAASVSLTYSFHAMQ